MEQLVSALAPAPAVDHRDIAAVSPTVDGLAIGALSRAVDRRAPSRTVDRRAISAPSRAVGRRGPTCAVGRRAFSAPPPVVDRSSIGGPSPAAVVSAAAVDAPAAAVLAHAAIVPAAAVGAPAPAAAVDAPAPAVGPIESGWTVVRRRKALKFPRETKEAGPTEDTKLSSLTSNGAGLNHTCADHIDCDVTPKIPVPWIPSGSRRNLKRMSIARFGGCVGTKHGLGYYTYGTFGQFGFEY